MDEVRLYNRVVLVTGGGQGIGAGIAKVLGSCGGAVVVITDLRLDSAREVAADVERSGGTALAYELDVTSREQVWDVMAAVAALAGGLDILVNNAGIGENKPFLEQTIESWNKIYAVNVFGVFNSCQAAIPLMRERGRGSIINIGSTAGRRSNAYSAHYGSSKHAVVGITQSLAKEFAQDLIRVNVVCPSLLLTPLWDERSAQIGLIEGKHPGQVIAERVARVPLGRPQSPEDIGHMVAFLASDLASQITGQAINVAGGTDL